MEKTEKSNLIYLSKLNNEIKEINETKNVINTEKFEIPKEKIRYYIFDNIKGILIFMVVFSHFLFEYSTSHQNTISRKIVVFIYSFHMPCFIFISGFLTSSNSIKIINLTRLLILYYLFNFSFSLIVYFLYDYKINFLVPQISYWYILSLFSWRIIINFLIKFDYIILISIIISLLEGYWECFSNILAIDNTIAFLPFFLAGNYIRNKGLIDSYLKLKKGFVKFCFILFGFFTFSYIIIIYIDKQRITNDTLLMNKYNENNKLEDRIWFLANSSIMIFFFLLLIPNTKIHIMNKFGKNSLYIYLFHRIITLVVSRNIFNKKNFASHIIELSFIFTIIVLFVFGSDFVLHFCNASLEFIHKNLFYYNFKGKIIRYIFCFSFILMLLINPIKIYSLKKNEIIAINKENHWKINNDLNIIFNNSIRISYVGDLIMLKDQVISSKNNITGKYNFDYMFKYTSNHFHESDLSIGVYEGPSAGNKTSYSTSNYDDNIPIFLNYPDEFAEAVKKAGINLVTTANNHLFDKKLEGALRTLDVLDKYSLIHLGTYRNIEEKRKVKIVKVKGINIAFLAYTSQVNHIGIQELYKKYNFLTNIIPYKTNKYYNNIYNDIKNDFIRAKKESPDIIIVLAHMGEQFLHHTVEFQEKWNKIFSDLGADIILGDHSHTVQPLEYIGNTLIINSPGNFANSYIKMDGDSTALIDIYINKHSKKVIGASAIPMYTKKLEQNLFCAIPIYDLINNKLIEINETERMRVEKIQLMSTKVLIGKEIGIKDIKKNYFFINNSYYDLDKI